MRLLSTMMSLQSGSTKTNHVLKLEQTSTLSTSSDTRREMYRGDGCRTRKHINDDATSKYLMVH
jgi:hypothetical protein